MKELTEEQWQQAWFNGGVKNLLFGDSIFDTVKIDKAQDYVLGIVNKENLCLEAEVKKAFCAGANFCQDYILKWYDNYFKAMQEAGKIEIVKDADPNKKDTDNVNHPNHYQMEGGLEVIDVMRMNFGMEAVYDFCLLNATKYIMRCNKKHKTPLEDLKKARFYLDYIINNKEAEERKNEQS